MKSITSTRIFITIFTVIVSLFLLSCNESTQEKKDKALVSVSAYFLYDIAKHIAADTVELMSIIPAGTDVHSFEPTPKIIAKVERSDLVFYTGAGLEPWISSHQFTNRAVAVATFLRLKNLEKIEDEQEHQSHDHGEHCVHSIHSSYDPHIWFDIDSMKRVTEIVTYELISLLPQNKDIYLDNRDRYIAMLSALEKSYNNKLQNCKLSTIITDHNAFSYLGDNYGFQIKTLSGVSPDAEVSPKDVIRILEAVDKYSVGVVFFEHFSSNKAMESIAAQKGVAFDSLHPLGNISKEDLQNKRGYEAIMLENLEKIAKALECS